MSIRKILRDITGLDDPPHKIAMGLALGIFVGFIPIMGIQMAVVLPFALLFRGNKTAAVAGVWVTNPITVIPIYYLNYKVGELFVSYPPLTWASFEDLFSNITMTKFLDLGATTLVPLFVGGLVLATIAAIPTYFITYRLVARSHRRKAQEAAESALATGQPPSCP